MAATVTRTTAVRIVGDETIVNQTTGGNQSGGLAATRTSGNSVITWLDFSGGGTPVAKARIIAPDNTPVGGELTIVGLESIAATSGGGFVIAGTNPAGRSFVQRYEGDAAFGARIFLGSTDVPESASPRLAAITNGGFIATETARGDDPLDPTGLGIFAQRFDSAGGRVGPRFRVNTDVVGDQTIATPIALSNGGFVIMWNSADPAADGSGTAVRAQVYSQNGQPVGGEIAVNATTAGQQVTADIAPLGDGGFVVHYATTDPEDPDLSFAQRFDATGAKVGAEIALGAPGGNFLRLTDGSLAYVYQASDSDAISVRLFDGTLTPRGAPFSFQGQFGSETFADATAVPGGILLTYSSPNNPDGSQGAVLLQRLELTETTNGTPLRDVLSAPNNNIWIAFGGAGNDDLTGGTADDRLAGGAGNEVLRGGLGDNRLSGGEGNDTLFAGGGRDALDGGAGDDRLRSSGGFELMVGGAGADSFQFVRQDVLNAVGAQDARIVDFSRAEGDLIDLSMIDARSGGRDDAFTFIGEGAFTGAGGELRVRYQDGFAFVDGDIDGDRKIDLLIKIDGATDLIAADFIL